MAIEVDVDKLIGSLPGVLGSIVGSYLAISRYYKAHAKRLAALEENARKHDPDFKPPSEDESGLVPAIVGVIKGDNEGKGEK